MFETLRIQICAALLILVFGTSLIAPPAQAIDLPPDSIKNLPMAKEESISTYIPSEVAPETGIAVNIIYPETPRYKEGAPVVVVAPGGLGPSGLRFTMHAAQSGFAEVRFAFPGGGLKQFHSGGSWDERGPDSQKALRDILMFAHGEKQDKKGKTISELVPTKLDVNNIGAVGWENGGNVLIVTLAKFPLDLGFLRWISFYESPIGPLLNPSVLGTTKELSINPHYRQGSAATGTCLVDWRKLCWASDIFRDRTEHLGLGRDPSRGVLFFDENGNKVWEESAEFPIAHFTEPGGERKYYAPEITAALTRLKLFPNKRWPKRVATLAESEKFFQERDGSQYVKQIPLQYPDMLVTIFGSRLDHQQRQPDHPHIALLYNLWLASKPKWVRLNPDPNYVGFIADMNVGNFVENKPDASIDAATIESHLEPEGFIPDYKYMEAAISELADRTKKNNLKPKLTTVLVEYQNEPMKKYRKEILEKQLQAQNAKNNSK
ncbi:MAG: hypothetical protein SGJ27_01420 [Candidatus Melainabacteria bacterium]|nr:hypothetical protein [Candidatus Melainabacteria bacterium]